VPIPQDHCPEKSILLLFESAVVKPANWESTTHRLFKYIFTWNDDLVDDVTYFKFNFPQNFSTLKENEKNFQDRKFCTLIAANKSSKHKNELYSERIKAIKWFERNHPDQLDLYGFGWDKGIQPERPTLLRRFYRKFPLLRPKIFYPVKTYKGSIQDKISVLKQYKYSICYDNAKNITGYITEKIFDSFITGTIPVYLGPPNIHNFIPQHCYIDKHKFKTYRSLYRYLRDLSPSEYNDYRNNIEKFLSYEDIYLFTNDFFVDQICRIADKYL